MRDALEAKGLTPEIGGVTLRAENSIEMAGDDAQRMQKLLDVLEDLDDAGRFPQRGDGRRVNRRP